MTTTYRLKIDASYPQTKNEIFTQCDLDDCFTDIDKFGIESERANGREYLHYIGYGEGSLFIDHMAKNILKQARDVLIEQLKDMSYEPPTEQELEQLKIKVSLIDMEDFTEYGDKDLK